jgi:hypothetical protein
MRQLGGKAMPRYEYKFIKVDLKSGWSVDEPKQDYHCLIEEQGREGWRLVTLFAPATSGTGWASYFELIFERPQA